MPRNTQFIHNNLTPADLVCVMQYAGGSVQVLLDFTDDRDKLQTVVETLIVGEGDGLDETTSDASSADTGGGLRPG